MDVSRYICSMAYTIPYGLNVEKKKWNLNASREKFSLMFIQQKGGQGWNEPTPSPLYSTPSIRPPYPLHTPSIPPPYPLHTLAISTPQPTPAYRPAAVVILLHHEAVSDPIVYLFLQINPQIVIARIVTILGCLFCMSVVIFCVLRIIPYLPVA